MSSLDPSANLDRILVDLSTRFAQVPSSQLRAEIEVGLQTIASFLGVEDVNLAESVARGGDGARAADLTVRHTDPQGSCVEMLLRLGSRSLGALAFDARSSLALGSSDRASELLAIASVFAHAVHRKQSEERVADSLGFERLLAQLTWLVSRVPPGDMTGALTAALQNVAKSFQLDYLALLEFPESSEDPVVLCEHGLLAGDHALASSGPQLPELVARLRRGDPVCLARSGEAVSALSLQELPPDGTLLLVVLPLLISGAPLCALRAAPAPVPRESLERWVAQLGLAGSILASANARRMGASLVARTEHIYVHEDARPVLIPFEGVIGRSDALRYVLFKVDQVARTDVTTLLLGETGTGKGLMARAIHERGSRHAHPLVTVNCAALPAGLVETELFGRDKGGYTGAHRSQPGRFELAHRGTILLDEIGDLPLELQPKLLRVLQEGELERVGGLRTLNVDVRVIAATNRNLEADVRDGRFREDLYYRLNVFPITLPALRERREDIPELVRHLLARLGRQLGKTIDKVPRAVMEALQSHQWPGNIRELESVLTRALIVTPDTTLHLADRLAPRSEAVASTRLAEIERMHICEILARHHWHIEGPTGAAHALGMNPSTLRGRMRKLEIRRPQ